MPRAAAKRSTTTGTPAARTRIEPQVPAVQTREDRAIYRALQILDKRLRKQGALTNSPESAASLMRLHLAPLDVEHFGCLFLDSQHRMIAFELLTRGTVDSASVYPREVVRRAMELNASGVIFGHNHPSGNAEPSAADKSLTLTLRHSLALVNVRVLDHLVIGDSAPVSFAERGWI